MYVYIYENIINRYGTSKKKMCTIVENYSHESDAEN